MFRNARIVCKGANPSDYLRQEAERGTPDFVVSSSMIKEFNRCPSRWRAGYESPDSDSKIWGSLLDCRLLTPDQFQDRYAIRPDTYTATGMKCPSCGSITDAKSCRACKCDRQPVTFEKEWSGGAEECKDWLEAHSRQSIVTTKQVAEADTAIKRLLADETIGAWHKSSETQVWVAADWCDPKTRLVIPCRCLIDYLPRTDSEFSKCAGDLKSCRCGLPRVFQRQAFQFGYHVQAGFDLDLLQAATGEDRNTWCLIVQENFPPYEPGKRMVSESLLEIGRQTYKHALARYAACLASGRWPGYDDHADAIQGWSLCDAEPWMEYEALQDAMESDQSHNDDVPFESTEPS